MVGFRGCWRGENTRIRQETQRNEQVTLEPVYALARKRWWMSIALGVVAIVPLVPRAACGPAVCATQERGPRLATSSALQPALPWRVRNWTHCLAPKHRVSTRTHGGCVQARHLKDPAEDVTASTTTWEPSA